MAKRCLYVYSVCMSILYYIILILFYIIYIIYILYIYTHIMSILYIYIYVCIYIYMCMYMWMVMIWLRYGLEGEDQSPSGHRRCHIIGVELDAATYRRAQEATVETNIQVPWQAGTIQ